MWLLENVSTALISTTSPGPTHRYTIASRLTSNRQRTVMIASHVCGQEIRCLRRSSPSARCMGENHLHTSSPVSFFLNWSNVELGSTLEVQANKPTQIRTAISSRLDTRPKSLFVTPTWATTKMIPRAKADLLVQARRSRRKMQRTSPDWNEKLSPN